MDASAIQGCIKIAFEFRIVQKLLISSLVVPRPTSPGRQSPAGSAQPCSTALEWFEGQAVSWSLQKHRSSTPLLPAAGWHSQTWDALASHSCRTNCLCFSSCGVSSRLDSEEEPIMLCKNSPHNSKAYWSPEFSVVEDKRFESFCSKLQESKQKGEDKR